MIELPSTVLAFARAIEVHMAKAPTKVHAGIPIGNFDAVRDASGKTVIKPKVKRKSVSQHIQDRKNPTKKWKGAQRP